MSGKLVLTAFIFFPSAFNVTLFYKSFYVSKVAFWLLGFFFESLWLDGDMLKGMIGWTAFTEILRYLKFFIY